MRGPLLCGPTFGELQELRRRQGRSLNGKVPPSSCSTTNPGEPKVADAWMLSPDTVIDFCQLQLLAA